MKNKHKATRQDEEIIHARIPLKEEFLATDVTEAEFLLDKNKRISTSVPLMFPQHSWHFSNQLCHSSWENHLNNYAYRNKYIVFHYRFINTYIFKNLFMDFCAFHMINFYLIWIMKENRESDSNEF